MSSIRPVGIAGTGSYAPERVVDNHYFEGIVDTSDEWIVQRTGISERRFAAEGECTSDMCVEAGRKALEVAGVEAGELDAIVVGTVSPDQYLPACAPLVQRGLGAGTCPAFDVSAACSGFMYGLSTGEALVASGRAQNVLVVGAETLSRFINYQDRGSCILFGDGAGAVVLRPHEECGTGEILRTSLGADGAGYDYIEMPAGGSREPMTHDAIEANRHLISVRGREVYRFAVDRMSKLVEEMLSGHDASELGLIVPHQVNKRIIDAAVQRLDIPPEKVLVNIERMGNTSAASVPLALDEARRTGRLEPGKLVVLAAFGAGLTWGGALLRW